MLFNTFDFAVFFPIVFILYWLLGKQLRLQNLLIVVASYYFYGCWDWRFLILILFSTVVDYSIGLALSKYEAKRQRKLLLWSSILVNIGLLAVFKYYNFFLENFVGAFSFFGVEIKANSLDIILPVGISFYTFQTLSYTIDVYRKKMKPTKDFISFMAYVSFFPQLVAGPIERSTHLLPQFAQKRRFEYDKAIDGMQQIGWGLFKKMVIADNCAEYANMIFNNSADHSGLTLVMGALFFSFQIYGDFSGYSDIAIGTARLLGFDLMKNFAFPYFSRDIAEFWRRWHISLSTWFRDYLYIPLGGSRGGTWMKVRNTFFIFLVSGFWHGANWTFIIWGLLNAIYFLPLLLTNNNRNHLDVVAKGRFFPSFRELLAILLTFALTAFSWIFFRAEDLSHALDYIARMCSSLELAKFLAERAMYEIYILLGVFLSVEWLGRTKEYGFQCIEDLPRWLKYLISYLLIIAIMLFMSLKVEEFIYFQF